VLEKVTVVTSFDSPQRNAEAHTGSRSGGVRFLSGKFTLSHHPLDEPVSLARALAAGA